MSHTHSKTMATEIAAATPAIMAIIVLSSFPSSSLSLCSPLLGSLLPGRYSVSSIVVTSLVAGFVGRAFVMADDSGELFVTLGVSGEVFVVIALVVICLEDGA